MHSSLGEPRPLDVTSDNWEELKAKGFRWLTNLGWPLDDAGSPDSEFSSDSDYITSLYRQFGTNNVLIGLPCNHEGKPDWNFCPQSNLVGVYAVTGD